MTKNSIQKLLRAAINEAAMASVDLPKFDFSTLSDHDISEVLSRIPDYKLLRNVGQFSAEKRTQFEGLLRDAGQDEDVIQAHANHYSLVSQQKSSADSARNDIKDDLNDAGRQIGRDLNAARTGLSNFVKKLDL